MAEHHAQHVVVRLKGSDGVYLSDELNGALGGDEQATDIPDQAPCDAVRQPVRQGVSIQVELLAAFGFESHVGLCEIHLSHLLNCICF